MTNKLRLLAVLLCPSLSLSAQISLLKQQKFPIRVLNVGVVDNNGKKDTVFVMDPQGPASQTDTVKVGTVTNPPQADTLKVRTPPKKAPSPPPPPPAAYIKWHTGKVELKNNEWVVGIAANHIIIKQNNNTEYILQSYVLNGNQLKKVAEIKIANPNYDNKISSICSPSGNFYIVHDQNTFSKGENRKLEYFTPLLENVLTYEYHYGVRVNHSFVNNDSLCFYESDEATHKIYVQLYCLSLKKMVFEKETITSWTFSNPAQVFCHIMPNGYIIAANIEYTRTAWITCFKFNGDTSWNYKLEDVILSTYFIPHSNELAIFCPLTKDKRGPYQLYLSGKDGKVNKKEYINETYLKSFASKTNNDQIMFMPAPSVCVGKNGWIINSFYCYTIALHQQYDLFVILTNGKEQEVIELPFEHFDYSIVITKNNRLVITDGKAFYIYKLPM